MASCPFQISAVTDEGLGRESPSSANVCARTSTLVFIYKAVSDPGPLGDWTPSLSFHVADSGPTSRCCGRGSGLETMEALIPRTALMPSLQLQEDCTQLTL